MSKKRPKKIYEYKQPRIEIEEKLGSQELSPQDKLDFWLFENIDAIGNKAYDTERSAAEALH